MSTVCKCSKEKKRNTHLHLKEASWNIAPLLSYLRNAEFSPNSGVSFGRPYLALGDSMPNPGAVRGGGGGLGSPLGGFSPNTELVFWLFLWSYLTSGPFSCWYFLLLKQRFFQYYSNRQVMAILCCVAQKAASAAQLLSINMRTFWNCCLGRFREDGSMNTGSVHWPVCARQCDGPTEYRTQYSRLTREGLLEHHAMPSLHDVSNDGVLVSITSPMMRRLVLDVPTSHSWE